jgi:hypothetical protein
MQCRVSYSWHARMVCGNSADHNQTAQRAPRIKQAAYIRGTQQNAQHESRPDTHTCDSTNIGHTAQHTRESRIMALNTHVVQAETQQMTTNQASLAQGGTHSTAQSNRQRVGHAAELVEFIVQRCTVLHPTCCMANLLWLKEVFVLCQHKHRTHSTAPYRLSARPSHAASIANT